VAQLALAYGEGMVYGNVEGSPSKAPPATMQYLPPQPDGATGTYIVTTPNGTRWHIVATGTIRSVTRTVSVDVTPTQSINTTTMALWNYLYEDALTGAPCTSGGAVITLPILARGDFCVQSATITNILQVGGNLTTTNNAKVGLSSSPIPLLAIVGTCAVSNNPPTTPGTYPCDGHSNGTYASSIGTTLGTIPQLPAVDFQAAYDAQASLVKSGCPANLFDNDTVKNNSDGSISSVFFGSSYDCFVGTNEIRWNSANNTLFVNGTLYFDGSLSMPNLGNIVYSGQASLYFTGGVTANSTIFCGIAGCTTSWNPNQNLVVFVAQCTGHATRCVALLGTSKTQFAAYVPTEYYVSGNSANMGPILSYTFNISGGASLPIPIHTFPPGTPAASMTTSVRGLPPSGWSG